ncbi:unnamed protein product [Pedinophyceae sp. YPF-701]|nr:unnamed protein product [Pedinophyceae sp. YPF-701]
MQKLCHQTALPARCARPRLHTRCVARRSAARGVRVAYKPKGREDAQAAHANEQEARVARMQAVELLNGPFDIDNYRKALHDDFVMTRPFEDLRVGKQGFLAMLTQLVDCFPDLNYGWLTSGELNSRGLCPATAVIRGCHAGDEYAPFGIGLLAVPPGDHPKSFEICCSTLLRFDDATGKLVELQSLSDATVGGSWAIYQQLGADPLARLLRLVKQAWGSWHTEEIFGKHLHPDFMFYSSTHQLDRRQYSERVAYLREVMPDVHAEHFDTPVTARLMPSGQLLTSFDIVGHHTGAEYVHPYVGDNRPVIPASGNKVRLTKRVLLSWRDGLLYRMVDAGSEDLWTALARAGNFGTEAGTITESWDDWTAGRVAF